MTASKQDSFVLPCQRELFDLPEGVTYLNCAYFSPQLRVVREAGFRGVRRKDHPWKIGPEDFFSESEQVRSLFAGLIDANSDDIALIPSVSYGIAIAAQNVPLEAGQQVVLLEEQFPSNVYAWRERARQVGAEIVVVPRPDDLRWEDAVLAAITERTAVVSLPEVHWTDGSVVHLQPISQRCREVGAALVLDVTQSLGAKPLSVKQLRPAFLVAGAYKWLLGPYSLAYLYVDPAYHAGQPLEHNWLNREGSEDFAGLVNYRDTFQAGARRFDVGERSNFTLMPMALAALQQIHTWGDERIHRTLSHLTAAFGEKCRAAGLIVPPEDRRSGHILGVRFPGALPHGLLDALAAARIYVSQRGNAIRVAPHLYNDENDLQRLFDVLVSHQG